jgi:hypothetical protein
VTFRSHYIATLLARRCDKQHKPHHWGHFKLLPSLSVLSRLYIIIIYTKSRPTSIPRIFFPCRSIYSFKYISLITSTLTKTALNPIIQHNQLPTFSFCPLSSGTCLLLKSVYYSSTLFFLKNRKRAKTEIINNSQY